MLKERIPETNVGIQGVANVEIFEQFARRMRDKGLLHVNSYIRAGIQKGNVLEIGPGPGYVGLEWLKTAVEAQLTCLEISREMIKAAEKNSEAYGFEHRIKYIQGDSSEMPFQDNYFDGVFSNGSMHEWEHPKRVFNEIYRVLKPGGRFCITDLRRDINPLIKLSAVNITKPKEIRPGFISSMNAAYTVGEILELIKKTNIKEFAVTKDVMGLTITGEKK